MSINTIPKQFKQRHLQRGVSLLEVLISILIVAVGLLGIAKMQATSIANTQVSGSRGLVALQAGGLAALMHSNKGYWQVAGGTTPPCNGATACVFNTSTTYFGTACALGTTCANPGSGTASPITAYDVNTWLANAAVQIPGYSQTSINCDNSSATNTFTTCVITVSWLEKQSATTFSTTQNSAAGSSDNTTQKNATMQSYYLYVQP